MAKLSFGGILSQSFRFFFANLRTFFHLVTIPWIVSLMLLIGGSLIDDNSLVTVLLVKAIDIVPTIMFTVAWMRLVLLGPNEVGRLPGTGWSARETAFLVHLTKIAGITFLLGAFMLTMGTIDPRMLDGTIPLDPETAHRALTIMPFAAGFIVSALLALRVSFGLAATAVDLSFAPRQSWALSRGNGWAILGGLFVIFFSDAMAKMVAFQVSLGVMHTVSAGYATAIVVWTVVTLVSYAGAAVTATAQALIFRALTRS
jgi:hypothetical protein